MWVDRGTAVCGLFFLFSAASSITPLFTPDCSAEGTTKFLKSPINIQSQKCSSRCSPPLKFSSQHWQPSQNFFVQNNGYYAEYIPLKGDVLKVTGGPLCGIYSLSSLHFHWGAGDYNGSEHTIDGKRSSMELHMVYKNQKFATFEDALEAKDGLAIIGFLMQAEQIRYNRGFDGFTEVLKSITNEDDVTHATNVSFALIKSEVMSPYYHYKGSLTKSSAEPAQWILFTKKIFISPKQIKPFRNLVDKERKPLFNTFPLQKSPMGQVYRAFCDRQTPSGQYYRRQYLSARRVPSWTLQNDVHVSAVS